jgi:hypothetical protein
MRIANGLVASMLALGLTGAFLAPAAQAATIVIINNDGAGEGFNDPTVVAPVGGNPGVTVGAQRLFVFQYAANIWGALLPSTVTIDVRAQFNPQTCTATSAVLGSAGPVSVSSDFPGAPFPAHWYHAAEANKLFGADLDPANPNINATFNSNLNGAPTCLGGIGWYLGVDGNEGANIELLPVVLHELGHGLGFSTVTSGATGSYLNVVPLQPSIFDKFLYDAATTTHWNTNTPGQRQASAVNCGNLRWDGPSVVANSPSYLTTQRPPILRIHAPAIVAGDYIVGLSTTFGAPVTNVPVTGPVTLVNDGVAPVNDSCEPLPPGSLTGQIALVDRGLCGFAVKAKIVQDAGAIGVIVCDNAAGCPPPGMGGVDPLVTIPAVRVSQADGNLLKANVVGQTASLMIDTAQKSGMDLANRVWMYNPLPFSGGSSVSHFDVSADPNLLMEPFINTNLSSAVDLTLNQMADIGWLDPATPIFVAPGHVQQAADGVRIEFYSSYAQSAQWTSYRMGEGGQWDVIGSPEVQGKGMLILKDSNVRAGQTYSYRVGALGTDGEQAYSEIVTVTITPNVALALHGAVPNPAGRECTVAYTLGGVSPARIALFNVAGRNLRTIDLTGRGVGRHTVDMGAGLALHPGTYFVRLTQGEKTLVRPVVIQ